MSMDMAFVFDSLLLGIGLSMDAFSVSMANGLNMPCMKRSKTFFIAGMFAFFQALMPITGWICVHTVAEHFVAFYKMVPWIALILLCFIGINMIKEAKNQPDKCCTEKQLTLTALLAQGIATSIDALSVGFTIAHYNLVPALACALIIACVTFVLCSAGVKIGKMFGTGLSNKAQLAGGLILIIIGVKIFVDGVF